MVIQQTLLLIVLYRIWTMNTSVHQKKRLESVQQYQHPLIGRRLLSPMNHIICFIEQMDISVYSMKCQKTDTFQPFVSQNKLTKALLWCEELFCGIIWVHSSLWIDQLGANIGQFKYVLILADHLQLYVQNVVPGNNGIFQHNNATSHMAGVVCRCLKQHILYFIILLWLPYFLDLELSIFVIPWLDYSLQGYSTSQPPVVVNWTAVSMAQYPYKHFPTPHGVSLRWLHELHMVIIWDIKELVKIIWHDCLYR